jgi:hypothetical protein
MKLSRLLKIEGKFILKHRVPPLWPTYIHETRTTFAKAGIKVRCYWELFGEHIKNLRTFALRNCLPPLHPQEQKGGPFTAGRDFSLLA